jgi:EAL domain-containing protein (putative c-di-GMP-specific phosphodiesterase class I)
MGIKLSIDDFGTGYSSLSYLRHFPIDRLKIDKSFVQEIDENTSNSGAIVEAIIALSHSLRLSVIAEGVERQDQVMFLLKRSCNELQGYYFSHPLLPEALEELLIRSNNGEDFCLYHYSDVAM